MGSFVVDTRKSHVLVVDDDRGSLELMKLMLETRGYAVTVASSGAKAMSLIAEMLRQQSAWQPMPVDVILLDVMMPEANGFKICQQIKQDPVLRYVPVIMVTALDSSSDKVAAVAFGADGYITKPFLPEELSAACKAQVQIKRREEALLRRLQELEAINAVSAAAVSTLDSKRVASDSLAALMDHTDVAAAAIYQYDKTVQRLTRLFQKGVQRPQTLSLEMDIVNRVICGQNPMPQLDLRADPGSPFDALGNPDLESCLALPLLESKKPIGMLEVYRKSAFGFGEQDLAFYMEIGSRIGAALQNAEILTHVQTMLRRSSTLAVGGSDRGEPIL
jgi:DNA-binding response OmpR family regulator